MVRHEIDDDVNPAPMRLLHQPPEIFVAAVARIEVECGTRRSLWLPYVEVDQIYALTERARRLGATVLLEPREGPAGWRSVVSSVEAGQVALWEPKR